MIKFKTIYQLSFYFVALFIFLFGGVFQYLFGLSNTGLTLFLMTIMFLNYGLYAYLKKKIVVNSILLLALLYIFIIGLSGVINDSGYIRIAIYCIFPLLPLGIFLFFHINKKEGYLKSAALLKFVLFVAYIQLPILLIQRNFYDFLISFNNSGQNIASFDFLFGSFFVKSDHALGFFSLTLIIAILLNIKGFRENLKHSFFTLIYLSLIILLSESTISKGLLVVIWGVIIIGLFYKLCKLYKLLRIATLVVLSTVLLLTLYNLRDSKYVESKLGGSLENNFTPEKSYHFFKEGTAKRSHIIIAALTKIDLKIIGDGPYSYFDILTGEFKNTANFSQLIWSYFDLGLIGLMVAILYLFFLIKSLNQNRLILIFLLIFCSIYFLFNTMFAEIAILFTLFLIIQTPKHELDHNSVPRLEKKRERRL